MTVKDLMEAIENGVEMYGDEFLSWNVYTEQLTEPDKEYEKQEYPPVVDDEGWEYYRCFGFNTYMPRIKIFTVNVNY
jgi:hypothetical protein